MIPVTTLQDKKVALFGLGGSGFATARRLLLGGANVTAWDDNPDSVDQGGCRGHHTADLRTIDWNVLSRCSCCRRACR
jgi:UDP-N-acetylmuramoylalanine--D-glutamate ligase